MDGRTETRQKELLILKLDDIKLRACDKNRPVGGPGLQDCRFVAISVGRVPSRGVLNSECLPPPVPACCRTYMRLSKTLAARLLFTHASCRRRKNAD
jgi:hypothetical protein